MVMMPGPLFAAVEATDAPRPLLLLSASGRRFDQAVARELAAGDGFSLLCGRYEGVDQRVADRLCDGELSVGDYVLAGGEAAAVVVVDAVTRLVPGVMGNAGSGAEESFAASRLEYPQYTRPPEFRGHEVPEVLLSGDHARVDRWRRAASLRRTAARRPDLLAARPPTEEEEAALPSSRRTPRARRLSNSLHPPRSEHPAMNATDLVDRTQLRTDVPDFAPGDTLKVHVRVVEGNRERVQVFQGVVIRRKGSGSRETFTVRKVSFGVGVERTFPVHSPIIARIEPITRGDVRRAKLYYLRDRVGKAAHVKEKRD